ncbi:MAG: helix-turn-helix domain-containing protein [Candidatus Amoebophilus sp.]
MKAVLLYDEGWSLTQIAKAVFLSGQAVRKHLRGYQARQKLKPAQGGSSEKLTLAQSKELEEHHSKHTYLYVKDIVAYVATSYGVSYNIHGMRNWLQHHKFRYKKTALVPGKAN